MSGYYKAFSDNGYFANTQGTVSDANANGVVLAIMRNELIPSRNRENPLSFDTRLVSDWEQNRMALPGNQVRKKHLSRAQGEFDGKVDVILWDGKDAEFWEKGGTWKVTYFDAESGHHRVELIVE